MFIHIGEKQIISDSNCVGIFNSETLRLSLNNLWITQNIDDAKSVVIDRDNNILTSKVSPFTLIKRKVIDKDFIWRKTNE